MDQIKSFFTGMSPLVAFIVNASCAFLFWVLFMFAPIYSFGFYSANGVKILANGPTLGAQFLAFVFITAPIGIVVYMCIKHKVCPCMVLGLAATFLIFMLASNMIWGWAAILLIFLILVPWSIFSYFRGDAPAWVK